MAVSDREYFELMVENVQRSNADTVLFLKESMTKIEESQEKVCQRVAKLEINESRHRGIFSFIGTIASFIWLGILTWFKG